MIVSERCVCYHARLFGSELSYKAYYSSISGVVQDEAVLIVQVGEKQNKQVFKFGSVPDAEAAHSHVRRRLNKSRVKDDDDKDSVVQLQVSI